MRNESKCEDTFMSLISIELYLYVFDMRKEIYFDLLTARIAKAHPLQCHSYDTP